MKSLESPPTLTLVTATSLSVSDGFKSRLYLVAIIFTLTVQRCHTNAQQFVTATLAAHAKAELSRYYIKISGCYLITKTTFYTEDKIHIRCHKET
jgi:hypothetical protein